MMLNPETEYQQHLQRRRDLMRQAKIQSLMREAEQDTPRLQRRLLVLLSDLMISGGTRLRQSVDSSREAQRPYALEGNNQFREWIPRT